MSSYFDGLPIWSAFPKGIFFPSVLTPTLAISFLFLLLIRLGKPYLLFFYHCFLKPHTKVGDSQQQAIENFYKGQAAIYDATREKLLQGRVEMLQLVAAQLKYRIEELEGKEKSTLSDRLVWVDIGGGTGYNIECLNHFLPIREYFSAIYLVDLSPSLCDVARARFDALGWGDLVKVVCMDARRFKIEYFEPARALKGEQHGVDWITMSYSLSMIPDFYSVIDSLSSLLAPTGIVSVADFYVQSVTAVSGRTYTGGVLSRHVNWLSRLFWRTWFEFDRVMLDEGRRDYLEYRFGTIMSIDERNRLLGGIPYYIWIGCPKSAAFAGHIEQIDAAATESPYLSPANFQASRNLQLSGKAQSTEVQIRSKGFEAAVLNLSSKLPLPSTFYQNHPWRIYYDELLPCHTQFQNDYIYAFTWEDPRVDYRLLKINERDVVLALTSAGDNILSYIIDASAKRVHAVDMNPAQNHLLELKLAAFTAKLPQEDIWAMFGRGIHPDFRNLLINKLSPHLSSRAMQFWLENSYRFTRCGLYESGGSRIAIKMTRWLFRLFGVARYVDMICSAKTLNEQREIWREKLRPVILSWWVSWAIISNEKFLWKALGVPSNQRDMINDDYYNVGDSKPKQRDRGGKAMWEYVVNTLDPVVETSLIGDDNYFYELCLKGCYSKRCCPSYLTDTGYAKLTRPDAFDGVRIHTDGILEVLARIQPGTLTIAVVMDSMDWFDTDGVKAREEIQRLRCALALGGRVMFRSAGLKPWYTKIFEEEGFELKRVGTRLPGACIDRVNMYASTWIATKVSISETIGSRRSSSSGSSRMEELKLPSALME
ncbi:hypothetical protein BDZ91DRAFT_675824 [Kalaharituber pfeilii]|nr:hypothetical protein BDZ91DRAFT_675824 [Kalaharituber pfeilii]